MKSVVRSFIYVLRRFKTATFLNLLGLSVAFGAFIIIMMQIDYDTNFDKGIKNYDKIYRVELVFKESKQAVLSRPFADILFQCSPHIKEGVLMNGFLGENLFSIDNDGTSFYSESFSNTYPSFSRVFHLDMFEGSDKALDKPEGVLIPKSMALRLFKGKSAINKQLKRKDGTVYTIGGVYNDFPKNSSVKNAIYANLPKDENIDSWNNNNYYVFISVDSPESVNGLFDDLKKHISVKLGEDWEDKTTLQFTPLSDLHYATDISYDDSPKSSRQTVTVLFAIAFVIVIIAGVNFTNFSIALTPVRIKSINTQKVLGATVLQLRMSLLIEALLVSFIAFLFSLLLVYFAAHSPIANLVNVEVSLAKFPLLILFTGFLSVCVGILSGLYPSFYMTSFAPALVLKGNFGLSPKGRKMRNGLVGIQFVASLVLIIASIFMYMQNQYMRKSSLGYDKEALIVTDINKDISKSWDVFVNQLKSNPDIENVTYAFQLLSSGDQYMGWGRNYKDKNIQFQCLPVDPAFLDVMGIKVADGRNFREDDQNTRNGVFIFNETARKQYNLELNESVDSIEIIGFVPDVKFASFRKEVSPMAFYIWGKYVWGKERKNPHPQANFAYIKVKAGSDLFSAFEYVKKTMQSLDPGVPFNVRFFDDVLNTTYEQEQKLSSLITLFSLIAILISIVGVFGLVVFESEYRRKEIGIRKVLGSTENEILILFNKTYLTILVICFAIAVPIAYYAVSKWLESFAYRTPLYWWVFLLGGIAVLLITVITISWQSWRAATANPVNALKND